MTAFMKFSKASLCLVLLGGLSACASYETHETRPLAAIPAQVCGGDADSDGDGVNECHDRCPGTLRGEAVDQYGCPLPVLAPKPYHG